MGFGQFRQVRSHGVMRIDGRKVGKFWGFLCLISVLIWGARCSSVIYRPCTNGGELARDYKTPFQGTKKCFQKKDETGKFVNDGKYFEWYPSEKIAVQGEYKMGKKVGRWIEYDEEGRKILDQYFEDGKPVARP